MDYSKWNYSIQSYLCQRCKPYNHYLVEYDDDDKFEEFGYPCVCSSKYTDDNDVFFSNHTDECIQPYNTTGNPFICTCTDENHRWSLVTPFQKTAYKRIPEKLWYKKVVANMENYNEESFKWAVTRSLHPVDKNPQWITRDLRR